MNCETFREQISARPSASDAAMNEHAAACASCAAYAARARSMEAALGKALRIDTESLRTAYQAQAVAAPLRAGGRTVWMPALAGAAAGVVATLGILYFSGIAGRSGENFSDAILRHWYHEQAYQRVSDQRASEASLSAALAGRATVDFSGVGPVSYARYCYVAGEWVPHLVVQGEAGAYMVLLMPDTAIDSVQPLRLEAQALEGSLLPAGRGSIAVLGPDGRESLAVGNSFIAAVEWT